MRYPPEHKEGTRARLLEAGGALAKKDGFASTGVDGLMAAVGLTSGAFYSHFRSKAELLEAIVESELGRSLDRFAGKTDEQLARTLTSTVWASWWAMRAALMYFIACCRSMISSCGILS